MRPCQILKTIALIPARFGSTRFPGKPLEKIHGKSLIQLTYENTLQCKALAAVYVATDDLRIMEEVARFGGKALLTSPSCLTGTDRLAEAVLHPDLLDAEVILNVQGDEPCLETEVMEQVLAALESDPQAAMATAIMPLLDKSDNPNIVKCVIDRQQNALYFSRALIPAGFGYHSKNCYYRHMGIYAYRRPFLLAYAKLPPTPLQLAEDLEQLKALEWGYRIKTAIVKSQSIGVDTPEDLIKVKERLWTQNISSSLAESVLH